MWIKNTLIIGLTLLTPAWAAAIPFAEDVDYQIQYQTSDTQVQQLRKVRIRGMVSLGGAEFLEVSGEAFAGKTRSGFIRFDRIHAILPEGHFESRSLP